MREYRGDFRKSFLNISWRMMHSDFENPLPARHGDYREKRFETLHHGRAALDLMAAHAFT